MVKMSDLVLAAERASQDAMEKALACLRGEDEGTAEMTSKEIAAKLRVNEKTVRRKVKPVICLGGRNLYRLCDAREALSA
jgi:hypothetical protein